jgi:hypothetical protein
MGGTCTPFDIRRVGGRAEETSPEHDYHAEGDAGRDGAVLGLHCERKKEAFRGVTERPACAWRGKNKGKKKGRKEGRKKERKKGRERKW